MTKSIDDSLKVHLASRSPYLYLVSWEEDRVLRHVERVAADYYEQTFVWSITKGLVHDGESLGKKYEGPYAALEYIESFRDSGLFILLDFHPYLNDSRVVRKLRDLGEVLQSCASALVIVSPKMVVPKELEKDIIVMDYPLPSLEDVKRLFEVVEEGVAENPRFQLDLGDDERDALLQATLGLTENEARNVLAKALVSGASTNALDLDVVIEEKEQIIRKSGVLECYTAVEGMDDVGGLDELKNWLESRRDAFSSQAREFGLPYPRGLLMTGVPGCGKSLVAKAVASRWRQPLLRLDVGALFGSLVGASEENIRKSLEVAEAVAPAILWIDEIEKGFSGFEGTGDSGTSARVFSTFLTWLQEKTSPVFVMATSNNIKHLPPEMLRKGRFDEIFFVDLPLAAERETIFRLHLERRGRDPEALGIDLPALAAATSSFSGAEIEQAVIAAMFKAYGLGTDVSTEVLQSCIAATYPLAHTMREPIEQMREWARHRARYASAQWRDQEGKLHPTQRWAQLSTVDNTP